MRNRDHPPSAEDAVHVPGSIRGVRVFPGSGDRNGCGLRKDRRRAVEKCRRG